VSYKRRDRAFEAWAPSESVQPRSPALPDCWVRKHWMMLKSIQSRSTSA